MMDVGIITFLHNSNYGSTLQAFALQQIIRDLGYTAAHVDYQPDLAEKVRNILRCGNSPRLILDGFKKRSARRKHPGLQQSSAAIRAFQRKYMTLTPLCRNGKDLRSQAESFRVLLCGSDQIWSPVWLNPAYFLDFALPGQKKLAYAPSMGVSAIFSPAKKRRIMRLCEGFSALSMREAEGARTLGQLLGREIPVMPDPVALAYPYWQRFRAEAARQTSGGRREIVCYLLSSSPALHAEVEAQARTLAQEINDCQVSENSAGGDPEQWLTRLASAAFVLTDSFHATVFSTIFHVPFRVFRRERADAKDSKFSRISQWLDATGITDPEHPDWALVDARLEKMRAQGLAWLKAALQAALEATPSQGR